MSLREVVVTRTEPGGCAVNLSDGLAALGARVELFATLGAPVHPAFAPVLQRLAAVHPVGAMHGRTTALEFGDGKLMLAAVAQLAGLDADLAQRALLQAGYPEACARADLIALTNWTLYPHMTAVWELLSDRVFARLPRRVPILVDLVDPGGRDPADVRAMLAVLARMPAVSLGLNLNEANILARLLGVAGGADDAGLPGLAARLRAAVAVDEVVIHALRHAACSDGALVAGPYTAAPVRLTGAGDRFNAGYALGAMLRLPSEQRLALGCASSGSYVRSGASADAEAVAAIAAAQ
ncbi:MAG: carbohydrate kinase [Planctomycetes bacterium]|nr:carbohydrate kinase [Planctomycetota bacterium]